MSPPTGASTPTPGARFKVDVPSSLPPWKARIFALILPVLRRILAIGTVNRLFGQVERAVAAGEDPFVALNRITGIHPIFSPQDLARIPRTGPLVIVSNHPFGGADAQALASMLELVRLDVKGIINRMLNVAPFLSERAFTVDLFGGPMAVAGNAAVLRDALSWVEQGGCLCIFPAGTVSHLSWRNWRIEDSAWSQTAARIARRSGAAVLPVHIRGRNSWLFQLLGLIHPLLRTMLLPREYFRAFGRGVRVCIGTPMTAAQVAQFADDAELTRNLRVRTCLLKGRRAVTSATVMPESPEEAEEPALPPQPVALVPQHSPEDLAAEVAALPEDALLVRQGEYEVWCTGSERLPLLMLEMGRLRELTFREVGEGSGRSIDIDRFDRHYRQLFVWNARRQELVGAYRMGLTDELLPAQGIDGLYTSTLFQYAPRVLEQLGPAIELGRSYVRREYQRKPLPLLLLWRGIAEFIGRHPRYVIVFGPVSISDEYLTMSKKLMIAFLETHRAISRFARAVRPRNPPQLGEIREWDGDHTRSAVRDVDEVGRLVQEIENGERTVPVLLRQYLRLNARLIAFNVDRDFGNVVDALMYADMREIHPRIQDYYLGREKGEAFRKFHGIDQRPRVPLRPRRTPRRGA